MATVRHLALVSDSAKVKLDQLVPVAAALQVQVIRDFAPPWRRPATVTAFGKLTDVPLTHWPMIVRDDIPYQAQGIHLDKDGAPFSLVLYSDGWSLTTSHECLEMLGDPLGKRVRKGPSIKPGQGDARYLVEVCDPCEADQFAYQIDGVIVSDFYLPTYFSATARAGTSYSHTGAITAPRQVLEGGYLSWQDIATGHWWQQTYFGAKPSFRDLGVFSRGTNPRRATDGPTEIPEEVMQPRQSPVAAGAAADNGEAGRRDRASYLRARVDEIAADAAP